MPTYDYRCTACRHEFEAFQSMSAKPLRKCPECDEKALERLIGTGAGIIFKGSGFYETDYRSEAYKKAAEADTKATSSDSKPSSAADATAKSTEPTKAKSTESASPTPKPKPADAKAKRSTD